MDFRLVIGVLLVAPKIIPIGNERCPLYIIINTNLAGKLHKNGS